MLEKVGKKLKKNNVSVDVISFGDCAEENKEKLEAFVAAVTKDDSSHYVEVPLGSNLSDFLLGSPVVSQAYGDAGGAAAGAGAGGAAGAHLCHAHSLSAAVIARRGCRSQEGSRLDNCQKGFIWLRCFAGAAGNNFEFGVDPNLDPELALALRVSMEEERARQAAAAQAAAAAAAAADPAAAGAGEAAVAAGAAVNTASGSAAAPAEGATAAPAATETVPPGAAADEAVPMEEDEDALLQQALALSMQVCYLSDIAWRLFLPPPLRKHVTATTPVFPDSAGCTFVQSDINCRSMRHKRHRQCQRMLK